ncbi:MAG: hypothetical protein K0R78_1616 [Pelosinus sp.]|nr:hypothetical protein [Pelosinus sp.]
MRYFAVLLALLMGLAVYSAPGQAKQTKYLIEKTISAKQTSELIDDKPILRWSPIPDAVMYEIEFLSSETENPNDTKPSRHRLFSTKEVYSNAYHADLSQYQGNILYWRVRPLNYHGDPISVYSQANFLEIDHNKQKTLKPSSDAVFNKDNMPTPLYPVYSWIPIPGAVQYEVEITNRKPENPNNIFPSKYRIWSKQVGNVFDCYDEEPRNIPGTYYWRVRGLDEKGNPVGVYSDARSFIVDFEAGRYSASFGDSIVHGGGSVSYSPVDWDYDFQPYLHFPHINLGHSGDTTSDLVQRFNQDVLPFHPRFLLILGGTNSLRGGTPAEEVIHDLSILRDKCLENDIRPIFLTLLSINPAAIKEVFNQDTASNWRRNFTEVNEFIRQQQYYIDLEPHFVDQNGVLLYEYAIDGLHPGLVGKQRMADIINENWNRVTEMKH